MSETNYSYETSLPAYKSGNKQVQVEAVLQSIKRGNTCLLAIAEDVRLPQSTVSGRVNDLIDEKVVSYNGTIVYKERKRKNIAINGG